MRNLFFVLLFVFPFVARTQQHPVEKLLYPIVVDGRWGYIDGSGQTVIRPQYLAAGDFFEGQAPVRQGGYYGFIGPDGKFRLPPVYDFASAFHDGLAEVWIRGKRTYIDRYGAEPFTALFTKIDGFQRGGHFAIVTTNSGKLGLLRRDGRLILDTVFTEINDLREGMYYARRRLDTEQTFSFYDRLSDSVFTYKGYYYTVLADTNGIVKENVEFYNFYRGVYTGGYALVSLNGPGRAGDESAFVGRDGEMTYRFSNRKCAWRFDMGLPRFSEGITKIEYIGEPLDQWLERGAPFANTRYIWLTATGDIIFPDSTTSHTTDFRNGTALGKIGQYWYLFNRSGRRISNVPYSLSESEQLGEEPAGHQERWIKPVGGQAWVTVDTLGRAIKKNTFPAESVSMLRVGKFWLLHHFFWDSLRNTYLPVGSVLEVDVKNGFRQGILKVVTDKNELCYLDTTGAVIWKEKVNIRPGHKKLNIDHRWPEVYAPDWKYGLHSNAGYGASVYATNESGVSAAAVQPLDSLNGLFRLRIDTKKTSVSPGGYRTYSLFLVNNMPDTMVFESRFPGIALHLEALNAENKWQTIQGRRPGFYCQTGAIPAYFLEPGGQWAFEVPAFDGAVPTKLRAVAYGRMLPDGRIRKAVSNEISVRINPAQFWRYADDQRIDPETMTYPFGR